MANKRIDELTAATPLVTDFLPATPTGGPSTKATVSQVVAAGLNQPNSATSGAGANLTIKAADGVTSGAGGSIILQPGAQATSGGDGGVIVKAAASGSANLQEWQNSAGTAVAAVNPSGSLFLKASCVLGSGFGYLDSNATAAGVITLYGGSGEMDFNATGAFFMTFKTTGTERMRILSGGNVGIGTTSPGAMLQVSTSAAATKGLIVKGESGQSANLLELQNNAGSTLSAVKSDGSIQPASIADSAATNNSIYYSTTASKLVYKDAAGTVNNLY